jgi:hypothetical protein
MKKVMGKMRAEKELEIYVIANSRLCNGIKKNSNRIMNLRRR